MVQNLKTTKYNDGTSIPLVTDDNEWENLVTPAYCWYKNDSTTYKNIVGAYYNWYSLDPAINGGKNVCPVGWHVPTDAEWTVLTDYLGGKSAAGVKLKEVSNNWNYNEGATNESGFTALPNRNRSYDGRFDEDRDFGSYVPWCSSTESSEESAYNRYLSYSNNDFDRSGDGLKQNGFSVRCLKD